MQIRVFQLKSIYKISNPPTIAFQKGWRTLPTGPAFFGGVNTFTCLSDKVVTGTSVSSIILLIVKKGENREREREREKKKEKSHAACVKEK